MNENSILLFVQNNQWIARFSGPMSREVTMSTGSNELVVSDNPDTYSWIIEEKVRKEFPSWDVATRWDSV